MQKRKKLEEISEEKVQRRLKLGNSRGRNDFFGHMFNKQLENEEVSTESIHQDMTANSGILVVGGAETTKAFLIATCQRLMQNPECLKKLTDEVRSKYSSPEEITGQSTASLEYLNAVIEEGLRLFPPLPLGLTRQVPACGTQISGHQIPGGTIVSTIPWVTAHSPKYWHKPTSFIPERWLGEGFGDCKEASQPFSLGPRGCIGINLAYLEMRITLAKMAYHLDWELVTKDIDPVMDSKLYTTWFMSSIRAIFHPKKT